MVSKITFTLMVLMVPFQGFTQQSGDTAKPKPLLHSAVRSATGKVMRRDNKNCPVVVRVVEPSKKDTIYLLPMGTNPDSLVVGTMITFNYTRLMIRNPFGCPGVPVRIWDIKRLVPKPHKKKKKTS